MPRVNARARDDPFVARLDALLRETVRQCLIRDALGGQIAASAEHASVEIGLSHYAFVCCAVPDASGGLGEGLGEECG